MTKARINYTKEFKLAILSQVEPGIPVAQLEDSGDGIPHQKGDLADDGNMATYTYI